METLVFDYTSLPRLPELVCAIGYFDGFHKGHQRLVREAVKIAEEKKIASAVLSFDPDPWAVFKPEANLDHLCSSHDKALLARRLDVDYLLIIKFDKEFAGKSVTEFHNILVGLNIQILVCGFDFTYGYNSAGNAQTLKDQNKFEVRVIEPVELDDQKISSSLIENLIRKGNVGSAGKLLGYFYSLPGVVVSGFGRGKKILRYPTANLQPDKGLVIPATGVYAGYVFDGRIFHPAMINIGRNPTFENQRMTIEAHAFDYSGDLYGKMVRFFFVEWLRGEKKFASLELLKEQLDRDGQMTIKVLSHNQALLAPTMAIFRARDVNMPVGR